MDLASGIAGLIGLVAVSVGATAKLVNVIQDIQDLGSTLNARLYTLRQFALLLKDLEINYGRIQSLGIEVDAGLVQLQIPRCQRSIRSLLQTLESALDAIGRARGLGRQTRKLIIASRSSRIERQFKFVQEDFEILERWQSSLKSKLSSANLESTSAILRQTSSHRHVLSNITTELHELHQCQDWLLSLTATLPLEIRDILRSEIRLQLDETFEKVTARGTRPNQRRAATEKESIADQVSQEKASSTDEDTSEMIQSNFQPQHVMGTSLRDSQQPMRDWHNRRQERFNIYLRRFWIFLGHISIEISRVHDLSNEFLKETLEIQLSIIPDPRWLTRALQLCVLFDHKSSRQSLCQIKLCTPGVRRSDDPLISVLRHGTLEEFIEAVNDGNYRPDDLYQDGAPKSLLTFAICAQKWDVAVYMLERWGTLAHPAQAFDPLPYVAGVCSRDSRLYGHCPTEFRLPRILRLMLNHGIINSIPSAAAWLTPIDVIHDSLKLVLAHPQSLPRDEIAATLWPWPVSVSMMAWPTESSLNPKEAGPRLIDEEAQHFESIFRMLGLDINAHYGYNCTAFDVVCGWNHFPEEWRLSRFRSLLRLGADPCLLNGRGESPMLYALSNRWHVQWCDIMAEMGLDVNAIAKHTYRESASVGDDTFKSRSLPHNVSRPEMLQLFSEASIYPDSSWFNGDEGNIYNLKASGVDFVPSTIYKNSKNTDNTMRKRSAKFVYDESSMASK